MPPLGLHFMAPTGPGQPDWKPWDRLRNKTFPLVDVALSGNVPPGVAIDDAMGVRGTDREFLGDGLIEPPLVTPLPYQVHPLRGHFGHPVSFSADDGLRHGTRTVVFAASEKFWSLAGVVIITPDDQLRIQSGIVPALRDHVGHVVSVGAGK